MDPDVAAPPLPGTEPEEAAARAPASAATVDDPTPTETPGAAAAPGPAPGTAAEGGVGKHEGTEAAASPTAAAAARAGAGPRPGPTFKGTLIGPFVVLDPSQQGERVNLKRELELLSIHQRDIGNNKEEMQLSLEQAFFLVEEHQRLQVYMPPIRGGGARQEDEAEEERSKPLDVLDCWRAFTAASPTFVRSVGSYRHFRRQGFVVHGGLNLGLDYVLYRGSPQRYHAEFGVLLRYPPNALAEEGQEGEEGGGDKPLTWRELHLHYRLIGEVRKTLIVAHVRLGGGGEEGGAAAAAAAVVNDGMGEGEDEEQQGRAAAARAMRVWYTDLSVYEVAVTPWRAGTPLARTRKGAGRGEAAAQLKRPGSLSSRGGGRFGGSGVGMGPPRKKGRGDGGGGLDGEGGGGGGGGEEQQQQQQQEEAAARLPEESPGANE